MTEAEFQTLTTESKKFKTIKSLLKHIQEKYVKNKLLSNAYKRSQAVQSTKKGTLKEQETTNKRFGITVRQEKESMTADRVRNNLINTTTNVTK